MAREVLGVNWSNNRIKHRDWRKDKVVDFEWCQRWNVIELIE
jgi:hypothetical protein